jgi:hypothetical protein
MAASATRARLQRNRATNYGTQIDQLGGIQVGTNIILVNLDTDRRFHNIRFQVTAVNYTGGAARAVTIVTQNGHTTTGATATITVNAYGVPVSAVVNAGGTGTIATGDIAAIADPTGAGAQWTVTAAGGVISALTYVPNSATPSAVNPGAVLGVCQLLVNGSPVGDLTAQQELNRALFNNETISLGQMPFFFTEPWRNAQGRPGFPNPDKITSWDMAGQNTFAIKMAINPGYQSVNCVGVYEYDFIRNTVDGEIDAATFQSALAAGKAPNPMLQIIARHAFTPTLNAGQNILTGNQVPILPWPILRMHCVGSTPGNLTQSILLQDGQTVESGFIGASSNGSQLDQLRESLIEAGFNTTLFDYSFVSDKGQRIQDVLKFAAAMKWSLYSTIAQGLTIVQERLQTRFE